VAERIQYLQGDLFAPVPAGSAFDLIVSNPPYIAHGEFAELAPDVRDHEPRMALDGGSDGLAFYRRIASGVTSFLKPGGRLLLEIGHTQDEAVRAILTQEPKLEVRPTIKDMLGHPRVVSARRIE
jgi:release factor glutamine methyltransferase